MQANVYSSAAWALEHRLRKLVWWFPILGNGFRGVTFHSDEKVDDCLVVLFRIFS